MSLLVLEPELEHENLEKMASGFSSVRIKCIG